VERPADECPYPKPFFATFTDCPAFQARQFIPLDTRYQPLDPVVTCRHLETRALSQRHRWYAACALGDAEARRRWVRELGVGRLERIRTLQRETADVMEPYSPRLWELKGEQLRALRDSRDASAITAQLRELGNQVATSLGTFLAQRQQAFAEVDLPIDAARNLIQVAIDRFIDTQFSSEVSFEVPDDALQRFPEAVRSFFRPSAAATEGS
jgi:multidrug efflux pump subunit AcrA (membrane-fusion protein)